MNTKERRKKIFSLLEESQKPITGGELAQMLNVSRQIIVGDISILRAGGAEVYATPQGYIMPQSESGRKKTVATIACQHDGETGIEEELNIMVDNGAKVLDVIVEHPLYGEIRADLLLASRRDVANFMKKLRECGASQLSLLTGGVHLHTLEADSEETIEIIQTLLAKKGFLHKS
jgi:hypothetical protein